MELIYCMPLNNFKINALLPGYFQKYFHYNLRFKHIFTNSVEGCCGVGSGQYYYFEYLQKKDIIKIGRAFLAATSMNLIHSALQ